MSSYDDFDTAGLKLRVGEPTPLGGSWSGQGDSVHFTVSAAVVIDPVTMTMPGHDPPVAWYVTDSALARMGFPVIACPGYRPDTPVVAGAATYMDPEPIILDHEPGGRP